VDLLNKSRGEYAYTLIGTDGSVSEDLVARLLGIEGVLSARVV
jgi:D-3-phosphoglycerate dehydrogenase